MKENDKRKIKKDELANINYSKTYDSLCSDRKKIVDQMYTLWEMREEEKLNKKGCR